MGEGMTKITSEEEFLEQYGDYKVRLSKIDTYEMVTNDDITLWRILIPLPDWMWIDPSPTIYGHDAASYATQQRLAAIARGVNGFQLEIRYPAPTPGMTILRTSMLGLLGMVDENSFWKWREYMRMTGCCPAEDEYSTIELPLLGQLLSPLEDSAYNKIRRLDLRLEDYVPFGLFPHASKDNDGMVAYTPDEKYGKQDRQVKMRIGKFLTKYLGDKLTPNQIKDVSNQFQARYGKLELHWAEGEEIADIYNYEHVGFSSCMAGPNHVFDSQVHPAAVYDSPDIALAWFGNKNECKLKARALINKKNKQYSVVYGNEQLEMMLRDLGYESGDLHGCKIRRIPYYNDNKFVMPYIDGDSCYVGEYDEDWFIISDSEDFPADSTDGIIYCAPLMECDCCGDRYLEEDMEESHEGGLVCEDCLSYYYVEAIVSSYGSYGYVHEDDVTFSDILDQHILNDLIGEAYIETYNDGLVYKDDAVWSDYHDEWLYAERAYEIVNDDGDTDYVHESADPSDFDEEWKVA